MKVASKWFRGVELTLWVIGVALLTLVAANTLGRWRYQAQQERALFQRGPAVLRASHRPKIEAAPTAQADEAASDAIARAVRNADHEIISEPPQQPERHAADGEPTALGRLEIPRLGLRAIVADGSDDDTLARAVGHLPGSALPGQAGNMVLAGHRDTFFWPLRDIQVNDRIRFVVPPETYDYRVRSMRVVGPEDTSVLASHGSEELTLVTCYPFTYIGSAPERFVVVATPEK